jgi:hypothetical protein
MEGDPTPWIPPLVVYYLGQTENPEGGWSSLEDVVPRCRG